MREPRLEEALRRFDGANAEDPRRETVAGAEVPREWIYGRRMTAMLERYCSDASVELRLAARAQHLCRWRLPREDHPEGRAGYLAWRRACGELHARLAAEILERLDFEPGEIERVRALLEKRDLGTDPEAQILEDVACFVFLENHLEDFAGGHPEERVDRVLRRTWRKMSPRGREFASRLSVSGSAAEALERALAAKEGA